jgi:hypothetical protein
MRTTALALLIMLIAAAAGCGSSSRPSSDARDSISVSGVTSARWRR